MLRSFDLHQDYGPMVGSSRLERWLRAERFGNAPPAGVRTLLEKLDDDHPAQQCIWDKYPL